MSFKFVSTALQIAALALLLAYPAVLIANAMQAAALMQSARDQTGSRVQRALMGIFVAGTTAYPLVLILCRVFAGRAQAQFDETRALWWSAAPLLFVGVLAVLFALSGRYENRS